MMCKICRWLMLPLLLLSLAACSGDDYLNAIPSESKALMSIDASRLMEENGADGKADVLRKVLGIDHVADCGIDFSAKVFLFESPEGDLGLCAKMSSASDLQGCLERLAVKGRCEPLTDRDDCHFTTLSGSWLLGYNDDVLMVIGPVVGEAKARKRQQLARYLNAGEEEGVKTSPLFQRLDTIQAPMALVARAEALPDLLVAPFTLGLPSDADPSQVIIEARMVSADGWLRIEGNTSSLNPRVDEALREANQVFRPITDEYMSAASPDMLGCLLVNVDGGQFLPLLQANKALRALMVGVNTVIDMDNIIRGVDGDMLLAFTGFSGDSPRVAMGAKLSQSDWLADVDYWMRSCPPGMTITRWGNDAYRVHGADMEFYFGVGDGLRFYAGSDSVEAKSMLSTSTRPLDDKARSELMGKRMVLAANLRQWSAHQPEVSTVVECLKPLFGELEVIIFCLR